MKKSIEKLYRIIIGFNNIFLFPFFICLTSLFFINCQIPEDELPIEEWEVSSINHYISIANTGALSISLIPGNYLGSLYYSDFNKSNFVSFAELILLNGIPLTEICDVTEEFVGGGHITIDFTVPLENSGIDLYLNFDTNTWFYASDIGEPAGLIVAKCGASDILMGSPNMLCTQRPEA